MLLFGYDDEPGGADFYTLPMGYEIAQISRSTGFIKQDIYSQVLVRPNSHSRWKALWSAFHANSSPEIQLSKTGSVLLINECVPATDEAHTCGVRFFSTAYDLKIGQLLPAASAPNTKTNALRATPLADPQLFNALTPQSQQKLGHWFWQNFWLKSAYEDFEL